MKPLKLTMQGFGSYIEKCTIDFTVFDNNNLFLITGSTGGGKTTILDAMCFALYCRATGGLRSWEQMRSVGIDEDTPTAIEFEFSNSGSVYRFTRSRSIYLSRNKIDKKVRDEHACYKLRDNEWQLIEAGAESRISARAAEILGLDCEQFSKVIVLPQGEFRKLLLSSSKEKTAIFEKLFLTEKWSLVTDKIRNNAKMLKDSLEDMFTERGVLLSSINVETQAELEQKLVVLRSELREKEQIRKQSAQKADELDKLIKHLNAVSELRKKIIRYKEKLSQQQDIKRKTDEEFKLMEAEHEASVQLQAVINSLNGQIGIFTAAQSNARRLEALEKQITDAQSLLTAKNAALEISEKSLKNKKAEITAAENLITQARSRTDTKPALVQKLITLQNIEKTYDKLNKSKEALGMLEKKSIADKEAYEKGLVKVDALQKELKHLNALKSMDMSALLAEGLKDGEPCPVCGSVHHPLPAVKSMETEDIGVRLDTVSQAIDDETKICDKLREKYMRSDAERANTEKLVLELQTECDGFNVYYRTVVDDIEKTRLSIAELDKMKAEADTNTLKLAELKKTVAAYDENAAKLRAEIENVKLSKEKAIGTKEQILNAMPENSSSLDEITEKLNSLVMRNSELTKQLNLNNKKYNDALTKQEVLKSQIKQLQSQLNDFESEYESLTENDSDIANRDIDMLNTELVKLKALHDDAAEQSGKLTGSIKFAEDTKDRLDKLQEKFSETESSYKTVARLSEIISGKNELKVSIKTFVLTIMLDSIITQSNIYLSSFSNSRYSLHRVTDKTRGNAMSGLDIEVFDAYYGMYRAVSTLSGGELFLASLSLAFGLSDVVQSHAGGVHLDSIFIDEGFGSLDKETLDTAMRALNQIKDMGRLVGIISHVTELMAMIEPKIVVKPDKKGSRVEIVAPRANK